MAKRGPPASIALEVARVQSLLGELGLLALPRRASGEEPETGLQERGQGGIGLEDEEAGQGCAITVLPEGEQSANPRLSLISSCHRLLLLSISSHISILTQKKFRPFFLFFLKCKKLSAALERGSLDRPFNAKKKGAADGA